MSKGTARRRPPFAGMLAIAASAAALSLAAAPSGGAGPSASPPPRFRILAPAENAVLPPGDAYVIGTLSGKGAALVQVAVDGKLEKLVTATGGGFWCKLTLSTGRHSIRVATGTDEATRPVSVSPTGDYRYHPDVENCEGCHPRRDGLFRPDVPLAALCGKCHKARDAGTFVHGPVAAGGCTACHDPHGAQNPRLQKVARPCVACHQPFPAAARIHEPLKRGACGSCHNPHSADDRAFLVPAGNALCVSCHPEFHTRHRSVPKRTTMIRVPEEFPMDNGLLACAGCHAPHQSNQEHLLRATPDGLCKTCHG